MRKSLGDNVLVCVQAEAGLTEAPGLLQSRLLYSNCLTGSVVVYITGVFVELQIRLLPEPTAVLNTYKSSKNIEKIIQI